MSLFKSSESEGNLYKESNTGLSMKTDEELKKTELFQEAKRFVNFYMKEIMQSYKDNLDKRSIASPT